MMNNSAIEIFKLEDGKTELQVSLANTTVWLSQKQMSQLFDKGTDTIGLHLKNIYNSKELEEISTTEEFSVVQMEGKRNVTRVIKCYNLDAIISVGYRVNSKRGTQFRELLKELRESVKITGNVLKYKELSNDESAGLLEIISDYAYALNNYRDN